MMSTTTAICETFVKLGYSFKPHTSRFWSIDRNYVNTLDYSTIISDRYVITYCKQNIVITLWSGCDERTSAKIIKQQVTDKEGLQTSTRLSLLWQFHRQSSTLVKIPIRQDYYHWNQYMRSRLTKKIKISTTRRRKSLHVNPIYTRYLMNTFDGLTKIKMMIKSLWAIRTLKSCRNYFPFLLRRWNGGKVDLKTISFKKSKRVSIN